MALEARRRVGEGALASAGGDPLTSAAKSTAVLRAAVALAQLGANRHSCCRAAMRSSSGQRIWSPLGQRIWSPLGPS